MSRNSFKLPILAGIAGLSVVSAHAVVLQNATATFSQNFDRVWNVSESIDGNTTTRNGWAIYNQNVTNHTISQTAVYETASNLSSSQITVGMSFLYGTQHLLGRFRFSATSDDRATFADGLQNGGDVTANWTVLGAAAVSVSPGLTSSVLGDGSILVNGTVPATGAYALTFNLPISNVTGFRLEVIEDSSLPTNGPGLQPNGNFVLTELTMAAVPEPTGLIAMIAGAAMFVRRRSK